MISFSCSYKLFCARHIILACFNYIYISKINYFLIRCPTLCIWIGHQLNLLIFFYRKKFSAWLLLLYDIHIELKMFGTEHWLKLSYIYCSTVFITIFTIVVNLILFIYKSYINLYYSWCLKLFKIALLHKMHIINLIGWSNIVSNSKFII